MHAATSPLTQGPKVKMYLIKKDVDILKIHNMFLPKDIFCLNHICKNFAFKKIPE